MKLRYQAIVPIILLGVPATGLADEVELPVPVLIWSFYVLLIFAAVVALGIFFKRGRNHQNEAVNTLLEARPAEVQSVAPDVTVTDCVRRMNNYRIGAMLVMDGESLAGIFTERDAITKVLGKGLDPTTTHVAEVMSADVITIGPDATVEDAMAIVTNRRVRHLPVVQDGRVLGLVSSGDLTHWLIRDRSGEIRQLVDMAGK